MSRLIARDFPYSNTFDGSTDYITLEGGSVFPIYPSDGSGTYSVEFWFKLDEIIENRMVFTETEAAGTREEFQWRFNADGTLEIRLESSGGLIFTLDTTTVFKVGKWYHLVWTDSSGDADLYVNGKLDSTDFDYTPSGDFDFDSTTIGAVRRAGAGASQFFPGKVTRPVAYNTKLTAQEVRDRYYRNVLPTSAVAEYLVDRGSGTVLVDNVGDNTGTLINDAWSTDAPFKNRLSAD